ncbi:MAG: TIGR01906 family membrane protein [Clostridiales bacterium]|nr:TIGR01906 family membrane protein [Clostridiales bacterium]OPZ68715.1 MAG: hypothetical protein BWY81_00748 [Firmicutes bacterium ADurb.Bin467]
MRPLSRALTAVGFFLLFAALLMTVVETAGTSADLYRELQLENGLPDAAGLALEEMAAIDEQLAGYLSGDASALDGAPFNDTEKLHMADVFHLFGLLRAVRNILLGAAAALLLAGLLLARGRGALFGSLVGLLLLALPLIALGIWAAIDFTSAFDAFHRALFSNDLWQLNPGTDLLIRMLPERFFSDFAAVVAVRAGLFIGAVPLALFGARFGRRFA